MGLVAMVRPTVAPQKGPSIMAPLSRVLLLMRFHRNLLRCLLLATAMATSRPVVAQNVTASFAGTINPGQVDAAGLFGPPNGYLGGLVFATTLSYNPADFSCSDGGQFCDTTTSGALITSITINNITQTVSTGTKAIAQFDNYVDFQNVGPSTVEQYFEVQYLPSKPATLASPGIPALGNSITFTVFPNGLGKSGDEFTGIASQSLYVVSPFLLAKAEGAKLENLDLATLLPNLSNLADVTATGL